MIDLYDLICLILCIVGIILIGVQLYLNDFDFEKMFFE